MPEHGERTSPLSCPFCGAQETDRFSMEGRLMIVFACMFTPVLDPSLSEEEVARTLRTEYGAEGHGYFRRQCDRLHYFVGSGKGKDILLAEADSPGGEPGAPGSP